MISADRSDLVIATATHPGETGKNNEDRFAVWAYRHTPGDSGLVTLAVVADGIGGHRAGEVAAELAVEAIRDVFAQSTSRNQLENIQQALGAANRAIYERAQANPGQAGMGCTSAVAVVADRKLYLAGVGDSRAYIIRGPKIQQMTTDHTWIADAIRAGVLTPETAKDHPNRHVVRRYVGYKPEPEVDYGLRLSPVDTPEQAQRNQGLALLPGDALVLCSDGLTDLVEDPEIHSILTSNSPNAAVEQLVLLARRRGGHDNITVVLAVVPGTAAATEKAKRLKPEYVALAGIVLGGLVIVFSLAGLGAWFYFNRLTPTPVATPARAGPTDTLPAILPVTATIAPTMTESLPADTLTPAPPTATLTSEPTTPATTASATVPGAELPAFPPIPTVLASKLPPPPPAPP